MTISRVIAATVASSFNQNPTVSANVGTGSFRKCRAWLGCSADTVPVPNTITVGSDSLTQVGAQQTGPGSSSMKWRLFESTSDLTVTGVQTVTGGLSAAPGSGASILLIEVYQGSAGALTFGTPVFSKPESGSAGSISSNVTATTSDKVVMLFLEAAGSTITATSPGTLSSDLGSTFAGSVMRDGLSGTTAVGAAFSGSYGVIAAAYTISEAGAAITATLSGSLDTITGSVTAGAAAITATLNGALDTITGNAAAGGFTGRLTSQLPLRDAARAVLANRSDVAVHVLGKPGLASMMLLGSQSIVSGIWTAPGPFTPGTRYNVLYEVAGEPIGCEIITATVV